MKRILLIGLGVFLLGALALWKARGPAPIPVQTAKVQRGRVEETVSSTKAGTLKARIRTVLGAQIPGRVTDLCLREGQRAKRGEPICLLDDGEQKARLAQAEAAVADAERQRAHQADLLQRKVISREELALIETRLAQDRAGADLARAQLEKTRISAPFDGLVSETFVESGQWVLPGTPVCEFLDDAAYEVEAEVDEIDSARLKTGQGVHLTVDAIPGERFEGVLASVSPAVSTEQEKNRTVKVRIAWTAERARVRPGMSVGVEVVVGSVEGALFVPSPAVMERGGRRTVFVVRDGRLREQELEPGLGNWETTAVSKGLEEGELVLVSGGQAGLEEGARVTPEALP